MDTPEVDHPKRTPAQARKRSAESDSKNVRTTKQQRLSGTPVVKPEKKIEADDPFRFFSN